MCLNPITIKDPSNPRHGKTVPCGVCLECKKKYQNSWSIRLYEELKSHKYEAVFFTLTIAPEKQPMNFLYKGKIYKTAPDYAYDNNYLLVDEETGEIVVEDFRTLDYIDFNSFTKPYQLKIFYEEAKSGLYDDRWIKFNSIRKKDVQEWNNRCRKAYKKTTGKSVKYFITPEYGPRTMKGHYHGVMFGINNQDFKRYFAKDWFNHFGRVGCESVNVLSEDVDPQKGGIEYVTKYCSKGVFEHPFCAKNFFYYYKRAGEDIFSEYHSKHYERCIEYFNIDEPLVDPCEKLISLNIGVGFLDRVKDLNYDIDIEDMIGYDLTELTKDAVEDLNLYGLESDADGNLYKVKYEYDKPDSSYELDDIVNYEEPFHIKKELEIVNQYIKIGNKYYSKVYRWIEDSLVPDRHSEDWNVRVHSIGGTFIEDSLAKFLLKVTNKLKYYKHGKNKNNGQTEVFAYAMPKYYREKMFSDEIRHIMSCVVLEEHDRVYQEQYRQLSAIHPDWKDVEITVFIEKANEDERFERARELNKKMKEFYNKAKI